MTTQETRESEQAQDSQFAQATPDSARASRPYTGDEYIESLQDGREVFVYGEKVEDVTRHPAFRNAVRSTARLYDALHDPDKQDVLTTTTDTGSGGITHPFFRTPYGSADMLADRDAIAEWARMTYGWMGRSPDYKASFLGILGANADFYEPFGDNARRWYIESQEKCLYWNHAIINPPVDRNLDPDSEDVRDVFIHVDEERDDGLIVSGAKVVATGSAITHYNFIAHYGLPIKKREFALVCTVPMGAPGMKLICRNSYSNVADATTSPFDYPLSSRFDENDSAGPGEDPVGERLHLRRRGEGQHLLPRIRLPAPLHLPRRDPAGGQARLHRRPADEGRGNDRHEGLPRHPDPRRRGPRVAQHVLGAVGRDGQPSRRVG